MFIVIIFHHYGAVTNLAKLGAKPKL